MLTFLNITDHLVPVMVTMAFGVMVLVIRIGAPYLKHINLVAQGHSEEGTEALAKHLAKKTGGKYIKVDDTWNSFVPVAQELTTRHAEKKSTLDSTR